MRISDWSSDVCSSDLWTIGQPFAPVTGRLVPTSPPSARRKPDKVSPGILPEGSVPAMGWTPDTSPNHNDPKEIIMATAELRAQSAPANPVRSINTDELESAICDMEVALALTAAIDNFLDQIRAWTRNSDLPREAQNAQVLLSELTDRLHKAAQSLFNTLYQLSGRAA